MRIEELLSDLLAVPGLTGVILLDEQAGPSLRMVNEEFAYPPAEKEKMLRGINQVTRQLRGLTQRLELRCPRGRFIIRLLENDLAIACVTELEINLPLLEMALEAFSQAASSHRQDLTKTFRAGQVARLLEEEVASFNSTEEAVRSRVPQTYAAGSNVVAMPLVAKSSVIEAEEITSIQPDELIEAANRLSGAVTKYLGRSVVANYWCSTQPDELKSLFGISMDGSLTVSSQTAPLRRQVEIAAVHQWLDAFTTRCQKILVDQPDELTRASEDFQQLLNQQPENRETIERVKGAGL